MVLMLAQSVFVPMYHQVHEKYFNNSEVALLKGPKYHYSFKDNFAEYYLPTVINAEGRLQFHRVVFRIMDEIREDYRDEVNALKQICTPSGFVDSENLILIAPKATVRRIIRGFRHNSLARGYMTYIIVNKDPRVAFTRALSLLRRFWVRRVEQLCNSLGITELRELRDMSLNYSLNLNSLNNSLNASETLQVILDNMISTVQYFNEKLRDLSHETQTIKVESIAAEKPKHNLVEEPKRLVAAGPKCFFCPEPKNPAVKHAIHKPSGKLYPACEKHASELLQNYSDLWGVGEEDLAYRPIPSNPRN